MRERERERCTRPSKKHWMIYSCGTLLHRWLGLSPKPKNCSNDAPRPIFGLKVEVGTVVVVEMAIIMNRVCRVTKEISKSRLRSGASPYDQLSLLCRSFFKLVSPLTQSYAQVCSYKSAWMESLRMSFLFSISYFVPWRMAMFSIRPYDVSLYATLMSVSSVSANRFSEHLFSTGCFIFPMFIYNMCL